MKNGKEIKPEFWAAAFCDSDCCGIDDLDKKYIKEIYTVFLFDKNTVTHLCEVTPSYFLAFLYMSIVFADNTPEDIRDKLDNKYGREGLDDTYMHVRDVEKLETKLIGNSNKFETFDDAKEYACGNCPF
jgi:hypothetical protein